MDGSMDGWIAKRMYGWIDEWTNNAADKFIKLRCRYSFLP